MKRKRINGRKPDAGHIVHKDKDLRIPNATPQDVARSLLKGGAPRRPGTAPKPA